MTTAGPYTGKPEETWTEITRKLVASHPLKLPTLRDAALSAWAMLWGTTVGQGEASIQLGALNVPASVVGYLFEVLLARELARRAPDLWRGNQSKEEKDLVYIPNHRLSVEIKTSGQAGFRVYGNRSYGQKAANEGLAKKEKSGFYITVNFFERTLTLIRFGWIDAEDWDPQEAQSGQMAGLGQSVYTKKLIEIPGAYRQGTPVRLLNQVGDVTSARFAECGIHTVGDLLRFRGTLPPRLEAIRGANEQFLVKCQDAVPL